MNLYMKEGLEGWVNVEGNWSSNVCITWHVAKGVTARETLYWVAYIWEYKLVWGRMDPHGNPQGAWHVRKSVRNQICDMTRMPDPNAPPASNPDFIEHWMIHDEDMSCP